MTRVFDCERYELTPDRAQIGETDFACEAAQLINAKRKREGKPATIIVYHAGVDAFFVVAEGATR